MGRPGVDVGVLLSGTGSYGTVGAAMRAGVHLAVAAVNADPGFDFTLTLHDTDPGGETARYVTGARAMLAEARITHVIGCYTSSSRKEVLPLFEKYDALLWYPSHYEGFETSDNVIYTGAAPNQHVIPLTRYLLETTGRRGFFIGSNYIWAWENHRIMREALAQSGGSVLGERYFPVGETDLGAVIGQILDLSPDFVFTTLIGESAYAFYRDFRTAAARRGIDQAAAMPIASCSLAEPELARIGGEAAAGHLSSSVYFSTVATAENRAFVAEWQRRFPGLGPTSADAEASAVAVHLLARAIRLAGGTGFEAVRAATADLGFAAPQGPVRIDAENRHCHLWPRIGRSNAAGTFDILRESPVAVRPDPYLVWDAAQRPGEQRPDAPRLRVVP